MQPLAEADIGAPRPEAVAERTTLLRALGIVAAPLIAAIFLGWIVVQDSNANLQTVRRQEILVDTSDAVNRIVAELQRERGRSSGFISSDGREFKTDLTAQRKITNTSVVRSRAAFAAINLEGIDLSVGDENLELAHAIVDAAALMNRLPEIRKRIDALSVSRQEMMTFYTNIIASLLTVTDLTTLAGTGTRAERLGAMDALLLEAVEFAGQERAAGTSAYASKFTSEDVLMGMAQLEAHQQVLISRFRRLAPAGYSNEVQAILDSAASRRRDLLRDDIQTPDRHNGVTGAEWFAVATDVIDQFISLSSDMRRAQSDDISEQRAHYLSRYRLAIGVVTAALLLSLVMAFWQSRSFVRPIRNLAVSLRRLGDGRTDISVEGSDRQDLVGLLARSVARLVELGAERFQDVLYHAPIATSIENLDGSGRQRHNPALARFLNVGLEPLEQRSITEFMNDGDRDRAKLDEAAFQRNEPVTSEGEVSFNRPDGSEVWGLMTRTFVRGTGNAPDFVISQVLDITEAKRIEILKTNFVSTVSHELRTPLTSVSGAIGMLQVMKAKDGNEKELRLLDIAMNNCKRLLSLISDLLDVDRLTQGGVTLVMDRHEISGLIANAVAELEPYAAGFGVSLASKTLDHELYTRTDANRFTQILSNLVSNAVKFSPKDSEVRVLTELNEGIIRISVIDSGSGIDPEFADQLFGRFQQANGSSSRVHGGSGIGLHISKGLVEQLGGKIGFENNPDGGATFWFTLPLMDRQSGETEMAGPHQEHETDLPRVLHVEDDPSYAELLNSVLKGRARLITAGSFAAAKKQLNEGSFDLILIDWELPDGSGIDLLKETAISLTATPVIGLSANAEVIHPARAELNILKSRMSLEETSEIILRVIARRAQTHAEIKLRATG